MPETSIVVSVQDDYSSAVKVMADNTRRFSKDADGLQGKLDALNATKAKIQVDVSDAKKSISGLQKAYDDAKAKAKAAEEVFRQVQTPEAEQNWNEATQQVKKHREALENAQTAYEGMKQNMALVAKTAQQTQREIQQINVETSKMESRAGGGGRLRQAADSLKSLASAGMFKMAGDLLAQGANYYVSSAFGAEAGSLFGGVLSGAGSGAAMGAMMGGSILGIPGTAVGAIAGGTLGLLQGAVGVQQNRDEAFRGVVQEQYQNSLTAQQNSTTSGSGIAAGRETDQIAFSKLMGGDQIAADYLDWVKDTANSTPFLYSDLTAMSKTLAAYQYSPEEMQKLLLQVGDTGASLGLSTGDMTQVATVLGRMKSTDKASLEYLNQLTERGIPAMDYLAEKMGKTQKQVYEMISKSQLSGVEASQLIADAMGEANAGAMELQSKTFSGLTSTLEGWQQEMDSAMGQGYNETRKKGLEEQISYFEGPEGEHLSKANEMIGEFKANMENLHDQMVREAQLEAMDRIEAEQLTGMEAATAMQEAIVQAENKYMESEGYQLYQDSQKTLVGRLQEDLAGSWQNFGYNMAQEFTKGLSRASVNEMASRLDPMSFKDVGYVPQLNLSKHASGLRRVPRDDYPALLHQGERVLTAAETRGLEDGGPLADDAGADRPLQTAQALPRPDDRTALSIRDAGTALNDEIEKAALLPQEPRLATVGPSPDREEGVLLQLPNPASFPLVPPQTDAHEDEKRGSSQPVVLMQPPAPEQPMLIPTKPDSRENEKRELSQPVVLMQLPAPERPMLIPTKVDAPIEKKQEMSLQPDGWQAVRETLRQAMARPGGAPSPAAHTGAAAASNRPSIAVNAPVTIQAVHMEQDRDPEQVMEALGERVARRIAEQVALFMEVF